MSAAKVSSVLSARYAAALIDLAEGSGKTAAVQGDMESLAAMLADSGDLAAFVRSPSLSPVKQQATLAALAKAAKLDELTANFLGVLVKNRRLNALESMIEAFRDDLARRRGEVTADVQVAQDMTPAQIKSLQDSLSASTGKKVTVRARVEPSIMGGMIVTVGSQMIDDSIRSKLERLKRAMSQQANENNMKAAESA